MISMSSINRVCILGGTHGNELSGVHLVKKWKANPKPVLRSSFETKLLLGNPEAIALNTRYKDCDLNRVFPKDLKSRVSASAPYEVRRGREILEMMQEGGEIGPCQVLLDLHNTTANVKACLIYRGSSTGAVNLQMMRYVMDHFPPGMCFVLDIANAHQSDSRTLAPNGFGIEIGPQPQGVLRGDIFLLQEEVVKHSLDFIEKLNTGTVFPATEITVYRLATKVPYPRDADRNLLAMVHPKLQDQDWKALKLDDPAFLGIDGKTLALKDVISGEELGDDELYPVFINEAAYYEKDVAFHLTKKITIKAPAISY